MERVEAVARFGNQCVTGLSDDDIERLYRTHFRRLVGTARLLLGDREGAEEVVQEAFVRVFRARARLRHDGIEAYLRSVVINESRNRLRRRRVIVRHSTALQLRDRSSTPDDLATLNEEQQRVAGVIAGLSTRQRECVVLRYWLDLSEREIAEMLRVSVGSVKTHLHRALLMLADGLREERAQ